MGNSAKRNKLLSAKNSRSNAGVPVPAAQEKEAESLRRKSLRSLTKTAMGKSATKSVPACARSSPRDETNS